MAALRNDQKSLLGAAVLVLAIQFVPLLRLLALPIVYLNTHIHEQMHAYATVLTGGGVSYLAVHADGSGVTQSGGGFLPVIASAGYMGSMAVGLLLLLASRTLPGARKALGGFIALLAIGSILWLRGDGVGLATGALWLVALGALFRYGSAEGTRWTVQFLGLMLCLASWEAFGALMQVSQAGGHSDAALMQGVTAIPAIFWATSWAVLSLAGAGYGLWFAWHGPKKRQRPFSSRNETGK